jgi:hypothetical protein
MDAFGFHPFTCFKHCSFQQTGGYFQCGFVKVIILHQDINAAEYLGEGSGWAAKIPDHFQVKTAFAFIPKESQIRGT